MFELLNILNLLIYTKVKIGIRYELYACIVKSANFVVKLEKRNGKL